jgi:general secretion pathway protein J
MSYKKNRGFTLLEILVALFIFTIIAVIMTSALHTVLTTQTETEKQAAKLTKLQMALLIFSRDIEQAIDRPINNAAGSREASFIGETDRVIFTHAGFANPFGQIQRSTLQRTTYFKNNNSFIRQSWQALDQVSNTPTQQRDLFAPVTELKFKYLDNHSKLHNSWPPPDQPNASALPRGIQIIFTLPTWGEISQFYIISGQSLDALPH